MRSGSPGALIGIAAVILVLVVLLVVVCLVALVRVRRRRRARAIGSTEPFRLIERLGEGGLAEVYAAVRRTSPRSGPLVVKLLREELAGDPRAIAHFRGEAALGALLSHPGIVSVFEHGEIRGRAYLAAEYVAGRDVGALTRRMVALKQRPLPVAAITYLAHEVCAALEHAHGRRAADGSWLGLVHRDITPENILVSRAGEVKLIDFGIAQSSGAAAGAPVAGNLDFMSPEQAAGQAVDARSDLFSLGLVMYFCAARAPLYRRKGLDERLRLAVTGPGEEERAFVSGVCPPLPEILARLLAVDPAERIPSARELRRLLAPHLAGGQAALAAALRVAFAAELDAEEARLRAVTRTPGGALPSTVDNRQPTVIPG